MSRTTRPFSSTKQLDALITQYFSYIEGEYRVVRREVKTAGRKAKTAKEKIWLRDPEPATLTGLALYLGFNSRQEFEACETKGRYAALLKRARLYIEAIYEKKLHHHFSSGAVFALKNMGWRDRPELEIKDSQRNNTLKIKILQSGPELASSEKEVVL